MDLRCVSIRSIIENQEISIDLNVFNFKYSSIYLESNLRGTARSSKKYLDNIVIITILFKI